MANVAERIQSEITENPVMLYMKGTAMFPQCGFSARVVQILSHIGVPFSTANVELLTARALKSAMFGVALPLTPWAITSEYHTPSLWPLGCRLLTV